MEELRFKLEKLLTDAEDYDLIAKLATDQTKREAFNLLAAQTRDVAENLKALIAWGNGQTNLRPPPRDS
jgi:hypothetical protein